MAATSVQEKANEEISEEAKSALIALRELSYNAASNGTSKITLDEINAEIDTVIKNK